MQLADLTSASSGLRVRIARRCRSNTPAPEEVFAGGVARMARLAGLIGRPQSELGHCRVRRSTVQHTHPGAVAARSRIPELHETAGWRGGDCLPLAALPALTGVAKELPDGNWEGV